MSDLKKWFVIINPTSGNGSSKRKWPIIKNLLESFFFDFDYVFTKHSNHGTIIVQNAIKKGFRNIICIGGDGTLHNIVNGIMQQHLTPSIAINVGVIPIGTGNDWVKTHNIPKDIKKAIQLIKKGNTNLQDIGKIELVDRDTKPIYFMNLAGIGFDGYVVNRMQNYKRFGALSYLIGAFLGLLSFKNFSSRVFLNSEEVSGETLMVLIGLCKYSGGGMRLTKTPNPFDDLFDITIAKNFSRLDVLSNLHRLFNGKIINFTKVVNYKASSIEIITNKKEHTYIQADGELVGKGHIKAVVISKSLRFYCR